MSTPSMISIYISDVLNNKPTKKELIIKRGTLFYKTGLFVESNVVINGNTRFMSIPDGKMVAVKNFAKRIHSFYSKPTINKKPKPSSQIRGVGLLYTGVRFGIK